MAISNWAVPASIVPGGTYTLTHTGGPLTAVEIDNHNYPRIVCTINSSSATSTSVTVPANMSVQYDNNLGYPWYLTASDGASANSSGTESLYSKVLTPAGMDEIGFFEPVIAPKYIGYYAADTSLIRSGVQVVYDLQTAQGLPVRIYADGEVEIDFTSVGGVESVQTFEFFFVDRDGAKGNYETFTYTPGGGEDPGGETATGVVIPSDPAAILKFEQATRRAINFTQAAWLLKFRSPAAPVSGDQTIATLYSTSSSQQTRIQMSSTAIKSQWRTTSGFNNHTLFTGALTEAERTVALVIDITALTLTYYLDGVVTSTVTLPAAEDFYNKALDTYAMALYDAGADWTFIEGAIWYGSKPSAANLASHAAGSLALADFAAAPTHLFAPSGTEGATVTSIADSAGSVPMVRGQSGDTSAVAAYYAGEAEPPPPNTAPTLSIPNQSAQQGLTYTRDLTQYADDADDDTLTYSMTSGNATYFSVSPAGLFEVENNPPIGSYSITVEVDDGTDTASDSFTFNVVEGLPPVPVLPADLLLEVADGETFIADITLVSGTASSVQLGGIDASLCTATILDPTTIRITKKTPFDHGNPDDL